jgi:hypothetical protein
MTNAAPLEPRPLDASHLQAIRLGEPQSYRHITVFPLLASENGGPAYVTLSEALANRNISVAELSQAGSVPELQVVNSGDSSVLLLDGEELAGAKQNRVLNTTILVQGKSEAAIPVSCTEQGRWSYSSTYFAESGVVMSRKARAFKSHSVSESLSASAKFSSDQIGVWDHIQALHGQAGTTSPTSAMLDAFKAHEGDLAKATESFPLVEEQHGLLVVVNGSVGGMDWVSRAAAYRELHPKLLKSYVFDGLIERASGEVPTTESTTRAKAFLNRAALRWPVDGWKRRV